MMTVLGSTLGVPKVLRCYRRRSRALPPRFCVCADILEFNTRQMLVPCVRLSSCCGEWGVLMTCRVSSSLLCGFAILGFVSHTGRHCVMAPTRTSALVWHS